MIEEFCKKWCISKLAFNNIYIINNNKKYTMADTFLDAVKNAKFDNSKVVFSSNVSIKKPDGLDETDFEHYLSNVLQENYPQLSKYQQIADDINNTQFYKDNPDLQIKFQPHFEWDKSHSKVTSVGIRATNSLCNRTKANRKELLKDRFDFDYQYDVKSSVPRITVSLNQGKWLNTVEDIYHRIYEMANYTEPWSDEMREAVKSLHMRAYFDKSETKFIHDCWLATKCSLDKTDMHDPLESFYDAVIEAEGQKTYGNEIFFVESCIYLAVLKYLIKGYNCWLVYDAFYFKKLPSSVDMNFIYDDMVEVEIEKSFNEFIKEFRSRV